MSHLHSPNRIREKIVVVGNGMVGFKFCERLVYHRLLDSFEVIVIGEEKLPAYDRIHLTRFFSGTTPQELVFKSEDWYHQNGVRLVLNDPVVSMDREQRFVQTRSGQKIFYDKVVLATGSNPFVPKIEGVESEGVFVYRTVDHLASIRQRAVSRKTAAVIGGGLLGLEAAKAMVDMGLETHVIEFSNGLMVKQLGLQASAMLREKIDELGLKVHLKTEVKKIQKESEGLRLNLSTGETLQVDLVVISAGIVPRTDLASECGLNVGIRGGVVINDFLQSSDPRIYAIGECALHQGRIYGLVNPGYQMANALVLILSGKNEKFEKPDLSTRLKLMGIEVATLGENLAEGSAYHYRSGKVFRELALKNGHMIGGTFLGPCEEIGRFQAAIKKEVRLSEEEILRFQETGTPWKVSETKSIFDWEPERVVCNCTGVTRGQLQVSMNEGRLTAVALSEHTGASTICGSCRPLLYELCGQLSAAWDPVRYFALLFAVCLLTAGVALVIFLMPGIPYSTTVQGWHLDVLWRNSLLKQITGYLILALAGLSLILSLRKRWRKFTFGNYDAWRLIHTVLGVISLAVLFAHTGFRFGHHLNMILMTIFVALAFAGSFAGGVTSLVHKWGSKGVLVKNTTTWIHVLLFAPLPALLVFHILTAYYY